MVGGIDLLFIILCTASAFAEDYSYDIEETPVTTDISCWMGNTRISPHFSLEKCDYWITYNATRVVKGSACIEAEYSVDGIRHVYRNCSYSVSSIHDPCERIILNAANGRIDMYSCKICWDNACNWLVEEDLSLWYLAPLVLLLLTLLALFIACACKGLSFKDGTSNCDI